MRDEARVVIRVADRPGDLGWIVQAHGEIYAEQFGWNTEFEALVAGIVGDYATRRDPATDAAWIAEVDGARAGCVLCVHGAESGAAQLRTLLVTPAARGLGVGTALVARVLAFARAAGYTRITLWTTDAQSSAHRIYAAAGFTRTSEEPRHSFGHEVRGQNWDLDLTPITTGSR
ncbi:GNAT family N-acetyltransferase [Nocardia neocaledoniensis]|uniref:GNAT family N-acetyltransferase n=1 Tax=Nocardia neocaledoniensis TaxID=236511 RepID=UPI0024553B9D|nr:GNAT family N-acetyltransferase [Nocardia neocaledoniensis]